MANGHTFVYDPDKVTVQVAETFLTGFSDGGIVSIEQNEDDLTTVVGIDGSVHYTLNHDKTATASVSMMSTSPMIPFLRELARDNRDFNFTMTDLNTNGIVVSCDECRIIKTPDYIRGKEAEEVEVEIFIPWLK